MKYTNLWIGGLCLFCACSSPQKNPIDYVDPFIGTGFHGHTYPGATAPFGAVQLSPDTRRGNWDASSGYHYSDSTILGFSHTHLSGTGCQDLGDVLLRPTTQPVRLEGEGDIYLPAAFSHDSEKATPGYYAVTLADEQIQVELAASTFAGMHRYTYQNDKDASVIVDLTHILNTDDFIYEAELKQTADNEIVGMRRTRSWVDNQYIYFVLQFSKPIQEWQQLNDKQGVAHFGQEREVIAKVGLSIVSAENARENLLHDMPDFNFEAVCQQAKSAWEKELAVVNVKGGTEAQRTNFYTAWYHSLVVPNRTNDINNQYRRHDSSIAVTPEGKTTYSTFSTWDTFRAWHPLMTLTDTELVNNMIQSLLNMYEVTGELPIWPLSSGETGTMIGYHSASIIADAYMKGIRGYDAEKALEAMIVSSNKNAKGSDYYTQYGFIPSNIKRESVSCLLEYAYDDWTIAQMAKAMGKEDVHKEYMERALNYCNVFDGNVRFFHGKRMDGNWEEKFNPAAVGHEFTEATAWQYRFFVPHDVNGMIQLFGGKEIFTADLDDLFNTSVGVVGKASDITGLIGQYAHGNEPSHHMAYLYNYIGQPWKTQAMTRRLLDEMYAPTPEGIVGNEDCGQMSAWYILSAMGFYLVCPGSNEFALTTPIFEQVDLQLANGKTLTVTANNPTKNIYIDAVTFNGQPIEKNFITYEQLMQGGTLAFTLTNEPNRSRGTSDEAAPYSATEGNWVSVPYINQDLHLFVDETKVALASTTEGCTIRYTLDGQEPDENSPVYSEPIYLNATKQIKAKAWKEGYKPSRTFSVLATRAEFKPARQAKGTVNGVNYVHVIGNFQKVADLKNGKVVKQGVMSEPSIKEAVQPDHFGYTFTGMIDIPEDGIYGFFTRSDDGSVLYIDGEKVVDNDGSHSALVASGKVALKKGLHTYQLLYLEDYEGDHLSWGWRLPGKDEFEAIPVDRLYVK